MNTDELKLLKALVESSSELYAQEMCPEDESNQELFLLLKKIKNTENYD